MITVADDKMTATWRERLQEVFPAAAEFSHLAIAEERPSMFWLFLSPAVWTKMSKVYVAGYRPSNHTLYLFRFRRGVFSTFAEFTEKHEIPLREVSEFRFKAHLLTATLRFRDAQGKRRKFKFALPSKRNSKAIFAGLRA